MYRGDGESPGGEQPIGHEGMESCPVGGHLGQLGAQVGDAGDDGVVEARGEVGYGRIQMGVMEQQFAVEVLQQRGVQGAVVVRVRDDERGGERVSDVEHHAALVGVDFEDAQRVVEASDGGAGVAGLHPGGKAAGDGVTGPFLPGDGRATELQREVALHGQVQRQETQPLPVLPASHAAARRQPDAGGSASVGGAA
nr:hypothetical protein [Micromonospora sonchi]